MATAVVSISSRLSTFACTPNVQPISSSKDSVAAINRLETAAFSRIPPFPKSMEHESSLVSSSAAGPASRPSRQTLTCQAGRSSVAERSTSGTSQPESSPVVLTYLEGNSWILKVDGVNFLVDPIVGSPLDFNIPWLYTAYKFVTKDMTVDELPEVDYLLITQSLDDHCHLNTLKPLAERRPDLPVIATPNAESKLNGLFKNVSYLEPGQSTTVRGSNGAEVLVKATKGPVLGPPWQRPENGYILRSKTSDASIYLEPHCIFTDELANEEPVQVVVTPVIKQQLPAFTLVSGQEDAVKLSKTLRAKYVVPMANAELDAKGLLSVLVKPLGTASTFEELLKNEVPDAKFLPAEANKALSIPPSE